MKSIERVAELKDVSLDQILLWVRTGKIITGRLARKIDYHNKKSLKELIENGNRKFRE